MKPEMEFDPNKGIKIVKKPDENQVSPTEEHKSSASQVSTGKPPVLGLGLGLGLDLAKVKNVGYQDEFMGMFDQFSQSWRDQIMRETRT